MERREFFQSFALTTLAVLGRDRQALAGADVRLTATEMDGYLRQLDAHHGWMATVPMDPMFDVLLQAPATSPPGSLYAPARFVIAPDARQRCETLLRQALRSLYMARSFRDLPEHGRAHPGMQRRIANAIPEMDAAVAGARDYLVGLSAADRLDLQRIIQQDPDVLPRLARHIDGTGENAGLPEAGRTQVSRQILHLDRQLRRGDVSAVLDEYVARVDRASAQAGTYADVTSRLRDHLGAPAFYTLQQRQTELAKLWWEQSPPSAYPGAGEVFRMGEPPLDEPLRSHRRTQVTAGAIMLGIGALLTIPGLAFIPNTIGLSALAATPGVALLIGGAILLGLGSRRVS